MDILLLASLGAGLMLQRSLRPSMHRLLVVDGLTLRLLDVVDPLILLGFPCR